MRVAGIWPPAVARLYRSPCSKLSRENRESEGSNLLAEAASIAVMYIALSSAPSYVDGLYAQNAPAFVSSIRQRDKNPKTELTKISDKTKKTLTWILVMNFLVIRPPPKDRCLRLAF